MKKVQTAYCVSKVEKGVRSFQMYDPKRWSLDMLKAEFFSTYDEAMAVVKDNIHSWIGLYRLYGIKEQDQPKYDIIKVEMKISVVE